MQQLSVYKRATGYFSVQSYFWPGCARDSHTDSPLHPEMLQSEVTKRMRK